MLARPQPAAPTQCGWPLHIPIGAAFISRNCLLVCTHSSTTNAACDATSINWKVCMTCTRQSIHDMVSYLLVNIMHAALLGKCPGMLKGHSVSLPALDADCFLLLVEARRPSSMPKCILMTPNENALALCSCVHIRGAMYTAHTSPREALQSTRTHQAAGCVAAPQNPCPRPPAKLPCQPAHIHQFSSVD